LAEPVKFEIEERLKCEITKDGDVKKIEVKGEGYLTILNPSMNKLDILVDIAGNNKIQTNFIDKKLFTEKKVITADVNIYSLNKIESKRRLSSENKTLRYEI
jgi:hypothetical protein